MVPLDQIHSGAVDNYPLPLAACWDQEKDRKRKKAPLEVAGKVGRVSQKNARLKISNQYSKRLKKDAIYTTLVSFVAANMERLGRASSINHRYTKHDETLSASYGSARRLQQLSDTNSKRPADLTSTGDDRSPCQMHSLTWSNAN